MTEQQELRAEVRELRLAVTGLIALLDEKVATKVEAEVRDKSVPREEYRLRARASGKRVIGGLVAVLVLAVALVVWNRVTLQQSQDLAVGDFRRLIATCRTTGPPLSPENLAFCERRVEGFSKLRERALETAAKTRRNEERLARVERELAKLLE